MDDKSIGTPPRRRPRSAVHTKTAGTLDERPSPAEPPSELHPPPPNRSATRRERICPEKAGVSSAAPRTLAPDDFEDPEPPVDSRTLWPRRSRPRFPGWLRSRVLPAHFYVKGGPLFAGFWRGVGRRGELLRAGSDLKIGGAIGRGPIVGALDRLRTRRLSAGVLTDASWGRFGGRGKTAVSLDRGPQRPENGADGPVAGPL
jgi:hypothetical protein